MTEVQVTGSNTPAASGARGSRVPGLDGCRAIAAAAVVTLHVWEAFGRSQFPFAVVMSNLWTAVPLFFSLSAFLLYRPLAAAAIRGTRRPRARTYFRNRFLRIAPLYWLVLLAAAFLGAAVVRNGGIGYYGRLTNPLVLVQDMVLVQNYNPTQLLSGMAVTWSLTDEVAFYLLVPVLGAIACSLARGRSTRAGRRNAALMPAAIMLCIGVAGRLFAFLLLHAPPGSGAPSWHTAFAASIVCKADWFSVGLVAAVLRVEWEDGRVRLAGWRRACVWAALLVIGGWVLTTRTNGAILGPIPWLQEFASGIASGLLVMLVVLAESVRGERFGLVRLLDSRLLVWGGLISYGIFLWHFPLLVWLGHHQLLYNQRHAFPADLVIVSVLSIALATLSYRLVEKPALRRRRHSSKPVSTPGPALELPAVMATEPSVARSSS